jgi:hypothetical protein
MAGGCWCHEATEWVDTIYNNDVHSIHVYEVRPRKDHRGVDLISDVLPFWSPVVRRAGCNQQRNRLCEVLQPFT